MPFTWGDSLEGGSSDSRILGLQVWRLAGGSDEGGYSELVASRGVNNVRVSSIAVSKGEWKTFCGAKSRLHS